MALMASLPSGPTVLLITSLAARHSPEGSTMPISGIRMSAASEDTTFPTAPPTMTATASASTLFFSRNSLNPLIIMGLQSSSVGTQKLCQPLHSQFQDTALRRVANAEGTLAAGAERHTRRQAHSRLLQ